MSTLLVTDAQPDTVALAAMLGVSVRSCQRGDQWEVECTGPTAKELQAALAVTGPPPPPAPPIDVEAKVRALVDALTAKDVLNAADVDAIDTAALVAVDDILIDETPVDPIKGG
jgi:hypothetical protein